MATLITVGNSEGSRRCDAKCYNATSSDCTCCCGGVNHGVGQKRAEKNTQQMAEKIINKIKKDYPGEKFNLLPIQQELKL